MQIINHLYRFKRATSARWQEVNPILMAGEPGFETDTHQLKIGDGLTPWANLPYVGSQIASYSTFADLPHKGDSQMLYRVIKDSLLY